MFKPKKVTKIDILDFMCEFSMNSKARIVYSIQIVFKREKFKESNKIFILNTNMGTIERIRYHISCILES